jgi:hypothetical protein
LEEKKAQGEERNGPGPGKDEKWAAVAKADRLPTAYVLSVVLLLLVNPVSPVIRENVLNAVLSWPVNF